MSWLCFDDLHLIFKVTPGLNLLNWCQKFCVLFFRFLLSYFSSELNFICQVFFAIVAILSSHALAEEFRSRSCRYLH